MLLCSQACYVPQDPRKEEQLEIDRAQGDHGAYNLPDGRQINIGAARFRAPEVLFDPSLIGEEEPGVHNILAGDAFPSNSGDLAVV